MSTSVKEPPKLSAEAAELLFLNDSSLLTPFHWEDYISNFPLEITDSPELRRSYETLVQYAENGVITETSALRFLSGIGDDKAWRRLWRHTVVADSKRFLKELPMATGRLIVEATEWSRRRTGHLPEGMGKALAHTFWTGVSLVGQTVDSLLEGALATYRMGGEALRRDDPELKAHTFFNSIALGLSLWQLGRGVGKMKTRPSIEPEIHAISSDGLAVATARPVVGGRVAAIGAGTTGGIMFAVGSRNLPLKSGGAFKLEDLKPELLEAAVKDPDPRVAFELHRHLRDLPGDGVIKYMRYLLDGLMARRARKGKGLVGLVRRMAGDYYPLTRLIREMRRDYNLRMMVSREAVDLLSTESFGGNAGPGRIGMNVWVDIRTGLIEKVGNPQGIFPRSPSSGGLVVPKHLVKVGVLIDFRTGKIVRLLPAHDSFKVYEGRKVMHGVENLSGDLRDLPPLETLPFLEDK